MADKESLYIQRVIEPLAGVKGSPAKGSSPYLLLQSEFYCTRHRVRFPNTCAPLEAILQPPQDHGLSPRFAIYRLLKNHAHLASDTPRRNDSFLFVEKPHSNQPFPNYYLHVLLSDVRDYPTVIGLMYVSIHTLAGQDDCKDELV